ncbi:MAG: hypothetical protein BWY21_01620 [Parcubacteria group bacterium ADurb.Bin216]|mgnify:FL=1|jgi:hypothetical protein|nr:MAG: hypothetical protein BWY21_01620 [Parcubacteria group bacterium ADurb.Bin216]
MATESEVKEAIKVILSDEKAYKTSLNYAVDYCKAALVMTGHELAIQCLYILNNIQHWRNPNAKDVRIVLKAFVKENRL